MKLGIIITKNMEFYRSTLATLVHRENGMIIARVSEVEEIDELKLKNYKDIIFVPDKMADISKVIEKADYYKANIERM